MSLQTRETYLEPAERGGPAGGWEVYEDYEVREWTEFMEGGTVFSPMPLGKREGPEGKYLSEVGNPHRARVYYPVYHPELPARLARVKDEATALAFVKEWGLLGLSRVDELWERPEFPIDPEFDDLKRVYSHAATIGVVLKLLSLLREDEPEAAIRKYLVSLTDDSQVCIPYEIGPYSNELDLAMEGIEKQPIREATWVVTSLINPNVRFLQPTLIQDRDQPGRVARLYTFQALLPVVYGHLMEAAEGRQGYYQCEYRNCEEWHPFVGVGRGPKRRYCPPLTKGSESRCSHLERYYRVQERRQA